MAAAMHLSTHMSNMFAAGVLDNQFQQLQMLKDSGAPDFVAEVVTIFCKESERIIGDLAKLLDEPCADFEKVDSLVHRLKGSSLSVGAQRVKNRCIEFHMFCKEKSKDGCLETLDILWNDLIDLRIMFKIMLELEKEVQASHPKK